ncbi:Transmembrane amino acid transporter [Blattamonas nauphoetae]|uniref:Transmembrane amino acid transporter n=1 Tax=Blattamonas nauphoetae TaxID=2049346 RepID=A0ABQ9XAQ8_9EUKA|nr:Transmembrane amino acid transporter [Blattamonas nauphoetae]
MIFPDSHKAEHFTRQRAKKAAILNAIIVLVNSTLGDGVFGMPLAYAKSGLLGAIFVHLLVVIMSSVSFYQLVYIADVVDEYSFGELAEVILGPVGMIITELCEFLYCFGSLWAYIILLYHFLHSILLGFGVPQSSVFMQHWFLMIVVSFFLLQPLSWLPTISSMGFTSYIGLGCMLFVVVVIIIRYFRPFIKNPDDEPVQLVNWHFYMFQTFSTLCFALSYQPSVPITQGELKRGSSRHMFLILVLVICGVWMFYGVIGIFGYLSFTGKFHDFDHSGNILTMYDNKDRLAMVARIVSFVTVTFCFPANALPARYTIMNIIKLINKMRKKRRRKLKMLKDKIISQQHPTRSPSDSTYTVNATLDSSYFHDLTYDPNMTMDTFQESNDDTINTSHRFQNRLAGHLRSVAKIPSVLPGRGNHTFNPAHSREHHSAIQLEELFVRPGEERVFDKPNVDELTQRQVEKLPLLRNEEDAAMMPTVREESTSQGFVGSAGDENWGPNQSEDRQEMDALNSNSPVSSNLNTHHTNFMDSNTSTAMHNEPNLQFLVNLVQRGNRTGTQTIGQDDSSQTNYPRLDMFGAPSEHNTIDSHLQPLPSLSQVYPSPPPDLSPATVAEPPTDNTAEPMFFDEEEPVQKCKVFRSKGCQGVMLGSALVFVATLLSIFMNKVNFVFDIIGSTGGVGVGFVLPCIMFLKLSRNPVKYTKSHLRNYNHQTGEYDSSATATPRTPAEEAAFQKKMRPRVGVSFCCVMAWIVLMLGLVLGAVSLGMAIIYDTNLRHIMHDDVV